MPENSEGKIYIRRTFVATGLVTLFAVALLINYGQTWAVLPLLAGVALAVILLWGWNYFIPAVFSPEKDEKIHRLQRVKGRFVLFALVKYPLVGVFLWMLTRLWDARSLAAFAAGFFVVAMILNPSC